MSKPLISVNICCFNSAKYIEETMSSVFQQSFEGYEVIIVDDGSTDRTKEIIKGYIDLGHPIKYYYQTNKGFGYARSKALELSSGEWIALLDHDDLWYSDKLKKQANLIDKHPQVKLFFSNSEWFTDSGEIIRLNIEDPSFKKGVVENALNRLLTYGCYIDSETALINRSALKECGGFNEQYFYITDYDTFIRLASKYEIYYDDSVLAKWRVHEKQASQQMKPTMVFEHVDLFYKILAKYHLNKKVEKKVRARLLYYLRQHATNQFNDRGTKYYFSVLLNGVRAYPYDIRTYLRIFKTIAGDLIRNCFNVRKYGRQQKILLL